MKKRIYELERDKKEAKANEQYAIEQMNKYKQKLKDMRKKEQKKNVQIQKREEKRNSKQI